VSAQDARFIFPPEPRLTYTWDEPGEGKYPGLPEFFWEVNWDLPRNERGRRPHGLVVVTYWAGGGVRAGSLGQMLAQVRPTVMTEDTTVSESVSIAEEDSLVTVALEEQRVVLRVEGIDAIARIFPIAPDSARFYRRLGAAAQEEEILVRVQRSQRSCGPTPE
jgi:hypothetical protein